MCSLAPVLGLIRQAHSTQQQASMPQHEKCAKATVWVALIIASKANFWITTEPFNKQIQFQHNKFKTNVTIRAIIGQFFRTEDTMYPC
jgi:hypothetical protein